jgi:hypothetical protein
MDTGETPAQGGGRQLASNHADRLGAERFVWTWIVRFGIAPNDAIAAGPSRIHDILQIVIVDEGGVRLVDRDGWRHGGAAPWTLISEHIYPDEAGNPFLRVRRYLGDGGRKQYSQSKWDGAQWIKGAPAAKVPYRLPELLAAPLAATVYVCEGEKCADVLARRGVVATTNSEGADSRS